MKPYIDLHIHSSCSDGSHTGEELLKLYGDAGYRIISITDHDNVDCYEKIDPRVLMRIGAVKTAVAESTKAVEAVTAEKIKMGKSSVQSENIKEGTATEKSPTEPRLLVIPGVELTFAFAGSERHMLGYGFDTKAMKSALQERYSLEKRIANQRRILEDFSAKCRAVGLTLTEEVTIKEGRRAEAFINVHRALEKHPENLQKYPSMANITQFFWGIFSNPDSELFVGESGDLPTMKKAIEIIHGAGGMAFLAHPYGYGIAEEEVQPMVEAAIIEGVDGIEVQHFSHNGDQRDRLCQIARQYKLYTSGGSDFHGNLKPEIAAGTGNGNVFVHYEEISPWINAHMQV